ncbi:MAG: hypothetical protein BWY28_03064 [bacterium ADurb.Bin236]|nr:MAG: hypothetical protein BWY28_03064 [bacterium ADurb.Bin236]
MKYKNALDILPPDLVEQIQSHFKGGLMWIPCAKDHFRERNELIVSLVKQNVSVPEVARLAQVSERWVWELVRRSKNARTGTEQN